MQQMHREIKAVFIPLVGGLYLDTVLEDIYIINCLVTILTGRVTIYLLPFPYY